MKKEEKTLADYYRRQAKHLIKDVQSGEAWLEHGAQDRISRVRGPDRAAGASGVRLGDCQEVVASEAGVPARSGGWRAFLDRLETGGTREAGADLKGRRSQGKDAPLRYLKSKRRVQLTKISSTALEVDHDIRVATVPLGEPGDGWGGVAPLRHIISFVPDSGDEMPWDGDLGRDEEEREFERIEAIYDDAYGSTGGDTDGPAERVFGEIVMDEFPVGMFGLHSDWPDLFDMRDDSPHTEQGLLVEALLDAGELPKSLSRGSIFYIHNLGVHPDLFGQGFAEHMLQHLLQWLGMTRSGLIVADPRFMWQPLLEEQSEPDRLLNARAGVEAVLAGAGFRDPSPDVIDMARYDGSSAVYRMIRSRR